MDREIAAAGHGVDFFSILWYYPRADPDRLPQARLLNRGLENFLVSTHAGRMRFMIEYCNARDFSPITVAEWSMKLEAIRDVFPSGSPGSTNRK